MSLEIKAGLSSKVSSTMQEGSQHWRKAGFPVAVKESSIRDAVRDWYAIV